MQSDKVDAVEYLPLSHAVQAIAPVALPLSVTEPAGHILHDAALDAAEYLPAAHAMHDLSVDTTAARPAAHSEQLVAPARLPALVIDPAAHSTQ